VTRTKNLSLLLTAAAVALVALVVAGCGGGSGGGGQATAATGSSTAGGGSPTTIGVSDASGLGKILVDSKGRTVYLFEKDTGPKSTCSGACAVDWPPVTTSGKPAAGDGLTRSMIGTTKRSDGTTQVTYNGHPLYNFEGDQKPGDTAGQNLDEFGAEWYVLSPAGNKVEGKAMDSGGTNAS
jgi:predicted lipoprotein with Yx(FWY)xxD motif